MELLLLIALAVGISYGLASKAKETLENRQLREKLARREEVLKSREEVLKSREEFIKGSEEAFKQDFCTGRKWLAAMIAEVEAAKDAAREDYLRKKSHPAIVAADLVREVKAEKRDLLQSLKLAEYQIRSYEEYFPFLEDFREVILEERVPLGSTRDSLRELEASDPVHRHLSREEYERLTELERNQLALDRYMERPKSDWEIGLLYERYLGSLWEAKGWRVVFHGAIKGYQDFGRDLICIKDAVVEIVQAKCWSRHKTIHEKHVFQLFATALHYGLENSSKTVIPVFVTTTELSDTARMVASRLQVRVENVPLPSRWPMIKCNVNPGTGEKIYHLPFDQQYDRAVIGAVPGECYVATVADAVQRGFRRAHRYYGQN